MAGLAFKCGGQALAEEFHDKIRGLYDSTFSAPPFVWTEDAASFHNQELTRIRNEPTFGITLATNGESLVGFAYGHTLPADHGWWNDFPEALPAEVVSEWEGRTFALIDFAVDKPWRGRGIGQRLLNHLFDGRSEERVVLSVQPTALETQEIYLHWGWERIGRKGPIDGVTPPYWDIFSRSL
jgi:GNAT superfamily N-acetyltransferase